MKKKILFIALFFAACLLPVLLLALGVQGPNNEKRALAAAPVLADEKGLNLAFPKEFETYLADNFGLRSLMVSSQSALYYYLLGDSANEKVIAGKDGWLFFAETLGDYQRSNVLSDAELGRLCRTLALQQEYLESRGIPFLFIITPNKNSIYGEYMPDRYARLEGETNAIQLQKRLDDVGIAHTDLQAVLTAAKSTGQLYHKRDTHWNEYGAWVGYREIMRLLKQQAPAVPDVTGETAQYKVEKQWQGDLDTMLMPAFQLLDEQTVFDRPVNYSTLRPMRSPEDMDITTKSRVNDLSVLMFRDSFTNALLPFLSNAFGTVHYTRAVPYDYTLLDRDKPDIVIQQIVERNLRELLARAPLMPAPQRSLGQYTLGSGEVQGDVFVEEKGAYSHIYGWALPKDGQDAGRIYVELYNENGSTIFEPFPVFEQSLEGKTSGSRDMQAMRGGGFSMLLDGKALKQGSYNIRVIVQNGDAYTAMESASTITP